MELDRLHNNKLLFLSQFEVLNPEHRRRGGQGTVQFAQRADDSSAVAIKFFFSRKSFDVEEALYGRGGLHGMMAAISLLDNNDSVREPHACSVLHASDEVIMQTLKKLPPTNHTRKLRACCAGCGSNGGGVEVPSVHGDGAGRKPR